jgi:signal transduction histidine kinase
VSSSLLLCIRSLMGECRDDQSHYECNPNAALHAFPVDTILGHILLLFLLPAIFKIHDPIAVLGSWVVAIAGIVVASIIMKSSAAVVIIIVAGGLAIGVTLYEKERDICFIFLTLRENRRYYEKLIDMDRGKNIIELEKDHLRNLIGNVAHDLKTPLQAFMSELSGLQIEVDSILLHWCSTRGQSSDIISKVLTNVDEMQKYLNSLRDIYQFMMMAINRAIDFRKAAAGLKYIYDKVSGVRWWVGTARFCVQEGCFFRVK